MTSPVARTNFLSGESPNPAIPSTAITGAWLSTVGYSYRKASAGLMEAACRAARPATSKLKRKARALPGFLCFEACSLGVNRRLLVQRNCTGFFLRAFNLLA